MFTRENKINKNENELNMSCWETTFRSFNQSKVNKLTPSPSLPINNRITKKNLLLIFLIIVTFPFITIKKSFATEETLEQKQKKIEMLGSELEEACKNYGKIRVSILSKQLISYGELSIPIFTKLLWTEKGLGESVGAWGLGELKSEKAVDVLIEKFEHDNMNGIKSTDTVEAIGKIGGEKAKKFLEKQLDNKKIEFSVAIALLKVDERHERAEEVLIELSKKDKTIVGIMSKAPQLLKYREKEVVEVAISILLEPKISEWNRTSEILSAADILVTIKYKNADDILIKAFEIQKNELARDFIIERIGKLKSDKAINFLNILENKSDKELSPFLKFKIKEIKGK